MKQNVIEVLKKQLNKESLFSNVNRPLLLDESSISITELSEVDFQLYYDESYDQSIVFNLSTKHENFQTAEETLKDIEQWLVSNNELNFESFNAELVEMTVLKAPHFISKEGSYYIYEAQFKTTFYVKKGEIVNGEN
ncbi:hypothetical protein [Alkalihalobacillus trypoxylicola]|uniref:Minor capsid protein n=1 Tax=Alkalihalobacillus trypoxylicola TaxID=519424 RepID=A0A162DNV8_9BACI|nr:hypothetical protein [Alkalihalobacillus trypoxylicola]KYG30425.1 hypothetical protein AZF04_19875 [Alkalihalobacillus trypoxylicola]